VICTLWAAHPDADKAIRELLARTEYYSDVDPHQIGGRWFGDVRDGKLLACVWCATDKPFAYIDYLAARDGSGRGLRLAAWLVGTLMGEGYTRILANVAQDNELMVRAITTLQGGRAPQNGPYWLVDLTGRS